MNSLIRLATLPDELSQGYSGRLARVNGFDSIRAFENCLALCVGSGQTMFDLPISKVDLLARMADLPLRAYVQSHSMLTLWRGMTGISSDRNEERDFYRALLMFGVRASRSVLHYCPTCAEADVQFHGMSYWRREHQIPGVYGCTKHAQPLSYTDWSNVAFSPRSLGMGARTNSVLFESTFGCASILRAQEMAHVLLQRGSNPHISRVYDALRPHLIARGVDLDIFDSARSHLLNLILESYPKQWLRASFADEQASSREMLFKAKGDRLIHAERPSLFWMLVLVAAAVTSSADEALNLWMGCKVTQDPSFGSDASVEQIAADGGLRRAVQDFVVDRSSVALQAMVDVHGEQVPELLRMLAGQWLKQNRDSLQVQH